MHNYTDDKYLSSNSFLSSSLASRKLNPFLRGGSNVNSLNQLPAIKEEGPNSEEESEKNARNTKSITSFTRLPPLNINCMMNINVKQSHSIWNTNFGRRLINENSVGEFFSEGDNKKSMNLKKSSKIYESSKPFEKTKSSTENKDKKSKEEKVKCNLTGKKTKKVKKENQNLIEKETVNEEISFSTTSSITKPTEKSPETMFLDDTSTLSLKSRPQFLSEHVRSIIIGHYVKEYKCEHCDKSFEDIKDLCHHEKQHEIEKETCLLCEKVFYNSSKFVQHLLTHEGVDRFSCKKCMTYFPNLRKLKEHNLEFHYIPPPTFSYISPPKLKFVEEWLPKFKCKRCKVELYSAKTYEAHRRAHLKKDLAGAYLLSLNHNM